MSMYSDRIKPIDYHIKSYLEDLKAKKYQVPTFQREVVWDRDAVKKLWDSIFRFYPIGSVLIWKTDLELQNHRRIGGHIITDDNHRDDFQYILDGQQRTTFLLTSLCGGKIARRDSFDPTLYYDLTVDDTDEIDDESYEQRFLFWNEIDDQHGKATRNVPRRRKFEAGLIVRLQDVLHSFGDIEKPLAEGDFKDYDHPIRERLRNVRDVLDNYRLSFIELKGITVSEVCQIFERINQEGKPLDIFDIVVAKTFRRSTQEQPGFYLRELIEDFKSEIEGNFTEIDDLTYLQCIAIIVFNTMPDAGIYNITPTYLNKLKTEHIEAVWGETRHAIRKLFDFLDNHFHLKGPRLVPFRYFYMSLVSYFFDNRDPDYSFLKKYFWFYSFHNDDLLSNTTDLRDHISLMNRLRDEGEASLDRFLIDRHRLRTSMYSQRGRLSSAILSLLANQEPRDWKQHDRKVLTDVYYVLSDKPNLHHIFPIGYLAENPGSNKLDSNSLMNIAYLTQITNLEIRAKNPLKYMRKYDTPGFEEVLDSHLVPRIILDWARADRMPSNALDQFIERRIDLIIDELRATLPDVRFRVIDTMEGAQSVSVED